MKKITTVIILLVLVLVATSAFAGDRTLTLRSATVVNGKKVPAGEYTMKYDIKGAKADVKILKENKVVAETSGNVVESQNVASSNGVLRTDNADGTSTLKEIQFANKKQVIRFEGEATAEGK